MKKLLVFVCVLLCIISVVSAHSIEDIVLDSGDVRTIVTTSAALSEFVLPSGAKDVLVTGATYTQEGSLLLLDGCRTCMIEYVLPNVIVKESNTVKSYSRTLQPFATLNYTVSLPPGYILDISSQTVVPAPDEVTTTGQNVVVRWDVLSTDALRYYVQFADHESTENNFSELSDEFGEWPVILIIILVCVVSFFIGFRLRKVQQEYVVVEDLLSPDEKTLLTTINTLYGAKSKSVSQKNLGSELSWSKSKISSVISLLVQKKLVEKEKVGRTYYVTPLSKPVASSNE